MARKARFCVPGIPVLLHQKSATGVDIIRDRGDMAMMERCIAEATNRNHCEIHAYGFLANQLWLVMTPLQCQATQKSMQSASRRYAAHFFGKYIQPCASKKVLWGERYHCVPLEADHYLIKAMCYVENQIERVIEAAKEEQLVALSSHQQHNQPAGQLTVTPPVQYKKLADIAANRFPRYQSICQQLSECRSSREIGEAIRKQSALGSSGFISALEIVSGIRLRPGKPGRPRKLE